jgi:TonB family protein
MLTVDAEGDVEDSVALEATHPAFVTAVQDALHKWRFEPTASATTPRREVIRFDFKRTGVIGSLSQRDANKALFPDAAAQSLPIKTVAWEELTAPPERIATALPAYPAALRRERVKGYAMVSFLIDAKGAVRVPTVAGSSDPAFGTAALVAVKQWRFAPPQHDGQTVHVRVERSFSFGSSP